MKTFLIAISLSFAFTLSAQEIFKENGKYGLKDESGKVLVVPAYKKIEAIYSDGHYLFKGLSEGDWCLLCSAERVELDPYESIEQDKLNANLVFCMRDRSFDVFSLESFDFTTIGASTDKVPIYSDIREGLYATRFERKKGLYDLIADDCTIYPEYDQIIENDQDKWIPFIAYQKKKSTLISTHGDIIYDDLDFKLSGASYTDSTQTCLITYSKKFKEGFVDIEREIEIPPLYDIVSFDPAYPNFIHITSAKGEGFYWKAKLILKPIYDSVQPTEHLDHLGEVSVDGIWYYVDRSGELILKK
jgi:hypothetical protein